MSWKSLETGAKLEFHISLIICTLDALSKKKHICMHLCIESIVKMMNILTKKITWNGGPDERQNCTFKTHWSSLQSSANTVSLCEQLVQLHITLAFKGTHPKFPPSPRSGIFHNMPKPTEYPRLLSGLVVDANFQMATHTFNEKAVRYQDISFNTFPPKTSQQLFQLNTFYCRNS